MITSNHKILFDGKLYGTAEEAGLPTFGEVLEAVNGRYYGRSRDEPPLPGSADAFVSVDEDGEQHLLVQGQDGQYRRDSRWDGSYYRRADLLRAREPTELPKAECDAVVLPIHRAPGRRASRRTSRRAAARAQAADDGGDGDDGDDGEGNGGDERPPDRPARVADEVVPDVLRLVPPDAIVLTTAAAARYFGYDSTAGIRMLVHRKKLRPFGRRGRTSVFLLDDLKAYLKSGLDSCTVRVAPRDAVSSSTQRKENNDGVA
jgi:hypothetical protein